MKQFLLPALLLTASIVNTADAQSLKYRPGKYASKTFSIPYGAREGEDYIAKKVVLKVGKEYKDQILTNSAFTAVLDMVGGKDNFQRMFPRHQAPLSDYNRLGQPMADLSRLFEFTFTGDYTVEQVANMCLSTGIFEWADMHVLYKPFYTPNDASGSQYYLTDINAFNAWSISKGDSSVVIGVVDSGFNMGHAEVAPKVKKNMADPINGNDDDGNGFTDDYNGWDHGDKDNNPQYAPSVNGGYHGVSTSTLAAAATDNGTGMAGVGFNCKFVPVKVMDAQGQLGAAFIGMIYAADRGCDIINNSFGGAYAGPLGQEIVYYCSVNKSALVVVAAGNDNTGNFTWPASYDLAFSVGGSSMSSLAKWTTSSTSGSTYNILLDVCAPAEQLYSLGGTSFNVFTGTSGASPIVAGAAALVKAHYKKTDPNFTSAQAGEKLRVSATSMYGANSSTFADKLGSGRIDMQAALTTNKPSVVTTKRTYTDGNDNAILANETFNLVCDFTNLLDNASNLTVTASVATQSAAYLSIQGNSTANIGSLNKLETKTNSSSAFGFKVAASTPKNTTVYIKLAYSDPSSNYTSFEFFSLDVNVDYVNITTSDITHTVTSKSNIGYNGFGAVSGAGFTYKGSTSLMYEGGLVVGVSATQVSDNVRNTATAPDADFQVSVPIKVVSLTVVADAETYTSFTDNGNSAGKMNISVEHHAYGFAKTGHTKYIIHKYDIKNNGSNTLNNLHAGLFVDWDVDYNTYDKNKANYDANNKMLYAYSSVANTLYVGTKLLSNGTAHPYNFDNKQGGGGGVDLSDTFTDAEKFSALSGSKNTAGTGAAAGNDICTMMSSGAHSLAAGQVLTVAFAIIAGDNLSDLQASAVNAQSDWDTSVGIENLTLENNTYGLVNYPNPFNGNTSISFTFPTAANADLSVYDATGRLVTTLVNAQLAGGAHTYNFDASNLAQGMYVYKLTVNGQVTSQKMQVIE